MFNDYIILKEVNSVTKLLSFLIFMITLMYVNDVYTAVLIIFMLFLVFLNNKNLNKYLLVFFIAILFIKNIVLFKLFILAAYLIFLFKISDKEEMMSSLEKIVLPLKNKHITNFFVKITNLLFTFNKNIKEVSNTLKEIGIRPNKNNYKIIVKKIFKSSKKDLEETLIMTKIRFYNYDTKKTYFDKKKWERWDTAYLLTHIFILTIIIVVGIIL